MQGKYKVITLCGSTKFKDEFMTIQKKLTLDGNIVISVGLFGHSGDDEAWTDGMKEMLDDMHRRKIDMADEIFVINVGGYIGRSTISEIEYAKSKGLPIRYYENMLDDPQLCDICYLHHINGVVPRQCEWYKDNVTFGNKSSSECPFYKPLNESSKNK